MNKSRSTRARTVGMRSSTRKLLSALSTAAVTVGLIFGAGVAPAAAVGPAVLSVEITPVDPATGQAVTSTGYGQHNNRLAYRIGYSCSVAECTDAVVTLPAIETDPTYGQFRLHRYETWTPPAGGGATITQSVTGGITVRLGNVAAGVSSTFSVVYIRDTDVSAPGVAPASYFPNGYQIARSATIASPNATANATAVAAPVTWQSGVPSAPAIVKTGPATVSPDTDMTYAISMSDGCMYHRGQNRWTSDGSTVCAESYTVVDRLPQQAIFVSATGGGTYNSATHTVTWTATGATAAGGWGVATTGFWTTGRGYAPRTVTVRYPASAFPDAAGGADFVAPVTNNVDVSVTYLDEEATTKTATNSFEHSVVRQSPFGRADQGKIGSADQDSWGTRYVNVPADTTGMVCPASGRDDWNRVCTPGQAVAPFTTRTDSYWQVDTYNRGNVPGVATVVDNELGNSEVRVRRITTSGGTGAPTIAWTITNGTTTTQGTTTATSYTAPAGSWLTAATVTSGSLAGPNLLPTGTAGTLFRVIFGYDLPVGSPLFTWRNNASATMTYPDQPQIAPIPVTSTAAVIFREWPKVAAAAPAFTAFVDTPVVEGGGQVVPGGKVTFSVSGRALNIPANRDVSPQYVFIAPAGWNITPNSASFPAGSVPAGVSFVYKNVTIAGVARQAVIASWPTGATFGSNVWWPNMSVSATPTATVAAGTNSVATMWVSDSRNVYEPNATTWAGKVVDTTDVDGDGNTTEAFATASVGQVVSGTSRLDVVKEICVETADGCDWVSNPDITVGVDPEATDITYRVTLVNGANTVLTDVVGYDVLPFVNDLRGSTFAETLNEITEQSSNVALTYSNSSNPCRPEVLATNPNCDADWTADSEGANSIRAAVTGSLAPGESASFVFTANVVEGAPADAIACNSVAVDSAGTLPSEPRPVCATTQEADLAIAVPDRLPLQAGRPGVVPFTVTNLGGSVAAPATVEIEVPAGIRITSLTPAGWLCTADETDPDGSVLGPVTLSCEPVAADGASRMLAIDAPEALNLPAVIPDASLVGDDACFPATISGLMSDPVDENNADSACFAVAQGESLVGLTKDDGLDSLQIGDEFTYTIDVANLLAGETLSNVVITDQLPATLAFVSASSGGSIADQGEADADGNRPGGTVTWNLASLAPGGQLDGDGDAATGGVGSTQSLTVTVRVVQAAETEDEIVNAATVAATDPALPEVTLTATDSDTDELIRTAAIQMLKSANPTSVSAVDDAITYSFLVTNSGDVTLTDVVVDETAFTGAGDPLEVICPAEAASLAPKATVTCTATYAVTQADLDAGVVSNTATATGAAPAGVVAPVSAPSTAVVAADVSSALSLVKTVTPETTAAAGDEVTYEFEVTNDGNVTVGGVEIVEGEFTGDAEQLSDVECASTGPVAPGHSVTCSATYSLSQADVDAGTVSNTATATADAPGGIADPISDPSTAVLDIPAAAALEVVKSVSDVTIDSAGDTVTYLFAVTNTGNVTVDEIGIEERTFTGAGDEVEIVCPEESLAPAGEMTCVGTYDVVQADIDAGGIDNTARVTGMAPDDSPVVSDESSTAVIIEGAPALSLVKSANPTTLVVDQEVTYSFVVTNTGNITVSDVAIDETVFTGSGDLSAVTCVGAASLLPDAQAVCQATYTITQDDVDAGELTNTAVATATTPQGAVNSEASTVELPFDQNPGLSVVKTADSDGFSAVGDEIGYSFRIANTGNVTMSDPAVVEGEFSGTGELSDVTCAVTSLLPGQVADCVATYAVTQADIDAGEVSNVATAEALAPGATDPLISDPSEVTVPFVGAMGLLLEKTGAGVDVNSDGLVTAGDTIRWSFVLSNPGAATLTELAVNDPLAGAVTCEAAILPPGATVNCTAADYRITSADASAGRVVNTATATAIGAAGAVVMSAEATATVQVSAEPSLLAQTGGQIGLWMLLLAALLLLLGAAIVWRNHATRREIS